MSSPLQKKEFTVTEQQKIAFASIFTLDKMLRKNRRLAVAPTDPDEKCLADVINVLFHERLVEIRGADYEATEEGKRRVRTFRQRYEEYLTVFDIFCAVDLATGEFAFNRYYDFADDASWRAYLEQERWEDLRVAVAMHKGLDPVEVVFMSYVLEGRFDAWGDGRWEFALLSGEIWNEILSVVNSNLHTTQLGYQIVDPNDPAGQRMIDVLPEDVMNDVIKRGADIMLQLVQRGNEISAQNAALAPSETIVEETVVARTTCYDYDFVISDPYIYYTPYLSPFYISPVWTAPLYPTVTIVF